MGNVKIAMCTVLTGLLVICTYGLSFSVVADPEPQRATSEVVSSNSASEKHQVTFIRDQDYKCVQCHKDSKKTLQGTHGDVIHAQTKRDVSCVDCHSSISSQHRDGAPEVNKLGASQSVAGTHKTVFDKASIFSKNQTCIDCHEATELREKNWTHDVHAVNLTCASCHTVHAEKDAMKGLERKAQIKVCVDCHSDLKKEELGERR